MSASSQSAKVQSFSLSSKKKKDIEKQKKLAEQEAAADVYEEFVATFEDAPKQSKLFVRGSVINSGSGQEIDAEKSGRLYKPDKLQVLENKRLQEGKKINEEKAKFKTTFSNDRYNEKPQKKKGDSKKKSNLEMFKEELKMIQEEREERFRIRHSEKPSLKPILTLEEEENRKPIGSHDTGDPNTTNIYLGNLNPKLSESQLCEIFGKYGPLASVKIMWPRTDEERTRNRNCGFVAYMCRIDGERALKAMNGQNVMDYEMRLGWGKAIPIPPNPIYIPPALRELTMPPPPSGLPFNAQVIDEKDKEFLQTFGDPQRLYREDKQAFDSLLSRSVIKVVMPTERPLLSMIHRVVEFVIREGPMFEALLMNREANNPLFTFLFDNQSPAHTYYRWRLFSVLQGDHPSCWRTKEFRMFEEGSIWRPPPIDLYQQGMPEDLLPKDDDFRLKDDDSNSPKHFGSGPVGYGDKSLRTDQQKRGTLSDADREEFEKLLRSLNPERSKVSQLMIFCVERSDSSEEITEAITDSLCINETPLYKKIARLYLVSDILHNCTVKVANVSNYRRVFQSKMTDIFESMHQSYQQIEGRLKAEQFKQRVMNCFRAWEDSAIYSNDFLIKLQNIFFGLTSSRSNNNNNNNNDNNQQSGNASSQSRKLLDIDGIAIDPDLDGEEMKDDRDKGISMIAKFKPSKWETIDPDIVESQAITSKWENLDKSAPIFDDDDNDGEDIDGKPLDDVDYFESLVGNSKDNSHHRPHQSAAIKMEPITKFNQKTTSSFSSSLSREVLREIELKVIKYQDNIEADLRNGRLKLSSNETVAQLVENYRLELNRKAAQSHSSSSSGSDHKRGRSRSRSPKSRHSSYSSTSSRRRSKSPPSRTRSRSRSPPKRRK